jgi:hypothetical protein
MAAARRVSEKTSSPRRRADEGAPVLEALAFGGASSAVGADEFAENCESNSEFLPDEVPTPVLRPKRGQNRAVGEKTLSELSSEFFRRLSEFFSSEQRIVSRQQEARPTRATG